MTLVLNKRHLPLSIFLTAYICYCCLVAQLCLTLLWPRRLKLTRLLCRWNSPSKNILESTTYSRDWTCISRIAGRSSITEPAGKTYIRYITIYMLTQHACICLILTTILWHEKKTKTIPQTEEKSRSDVFDDCLSFPGDQTWPQSPSHLLWMKSQKPR